MALPTILLPPGSRLMAGAVLGKLGGCLFGGAALWWVASHAGPQTGTAVVHVVEPDVVVSVGGRAFRVGDDPYTPVVCALPAGEHRLTMTRGEAVLYTETFSLQRGEERVLTAWRPPPEGAGPGRKRHGPGARSTPSSVSAAPPRGLDPPRSVPGPR
jgi:hypothetical protein